MLNVELSASRRFDRNYQTWLQCKPLGFASTRYDSESLFWPRVSVKKIIECLIIIITFFVCIEFVFTRCKNLTAVPLYIFHPTYRLTSWIFYRLGGSNIIIITIKINDDHRSCIDHGQSWEVDFDLCFPTVNFYFYFSLNSHLQIPMCFWKSS